MWLTVNIRDRRGDVVVAHIQIVYLFTDVNKNVALVILNLFQELVSKIIEEKICPRASCNAKQNEKLNS